MKEYMTGYERLCTWLTENDTNISVYGSFAIAFGLLINFLIEVF